MIERKKLRHNLKFKNCKTFGLKKAFVKLKQVSSFVKLNFLSKIYFLVIIQKYAYVKIIIQSCPILIENVLPLQD